MNTERETHFLGFAELLLAELKPDLTRLLLALGRKNESEMEATERRIKEIIASRAYDLVEHSLDHLRFTYLKDIPDMTAFPEERTQKGVHEHE